MLPVCGITRSGDAVSACCAVFSVDLELCYFVPSVMVRFASSCESVGPTSNDEYMTYPDNANMGAYYVSILANVFKLVF